MTELKSFGKNDNEKKSDSFLSFDKIEPIYDNSATQNIYFCTPNLYYENNKFYKTPKPQKNEEGRKTRICFCFRKKTEESSNNKCRNLRKNEKLEVECEESIKKSKVNNEEKKHECLLI